MNLNKLILVNNDCYKADRKIQVQGIMVHSTGVNNPHISRYVGPDDGKLGKNKYNNHWNQVMDRKVCVHAFIGKLKDGSIATYQTLPWDHFGWHAGGAANATHTSFEICEDGLDDKKYFLAVYKEATELCAYLCKLYKLDPLKDGVIIGHYEGYKRGVASNHGDPIHWFSKFGKSMDTFRKDVKALMGSSGKASASAPSSAKKPMYRVRKSWADSNSQIGAFKILDNAKKKADNQPGYSVFNESGKKIYPMESTNIYTVKNGDSLWSIAQKFLGDGSRYPEIKSYNGISSDLIRVGQVLKIPTESTGFKVGDTVRITAKRYTTGELIPDWVKNKTHKISEFGEGKVLL